MYKVYDKLVPLTFKNKFLKSSRNIKTILCYVCKNKKKSIFDNDYGCFNMKYITQFHKIVIEKRKKLI